MGAAKRGFSAFVKGLRILGQGVLAFMALTILCDAIMRYVFGAPTSWSLEVNTFLIVYIAVMTGADVQRTDSHIRITFFSDMAGMAGRRLIQIATGLVGVTFCAIMTWRGALLAYQAYDYGERVSSSFGTPLAIPYALLPIGFGALAIQFAIGVFSGDDAASESSHPL